MIDVNYYYYYTLYCVHKIILQNYCIGNWKIKTNMDKFQRIPIIVWGYSKQSNTIWKHLKLIVWTN